MVIRYSQTRNSAMKRICSLIIFGLLTVGLSAQDGRLWTLQDCIAHALENNISLKQQEIQVKQQEIQFQEQQVAGGERKRKRELLVRTRIDC